MTRTELAKQYAEIIEKAVRKDAVQGLTKSASYTSDRRTHVHEALVNVGTWVESLKYDGGQEADDSEKDDLTVEVAEFLGYAYPKVLRVLFKSGSNNALQTVNQSVADLVRAILVRQHGK